MPSDATTRAPPAPPVETIDATGEPERIRTVIVPDHGRLACLLADRIAAVVQRETTAKGHCVLGLATGSTPVGIYHELIRRHEAGRLDFSKVITFNLDEYYPMAPGNIHSYHRFMAEHLFNHVNIEPSNIHIPDGTAARASLAAYCDRYESAIEEVGGIDFQILGIGRSGQIGFNEPGSSPTSTTRLITLDTITRLDAAAAFYGEPNVPREAITMGIATILAAREIALIATGEHKARIIRRAVEGEVSHDVTATFLQRHGNATVYLDSPAAADLTRVRTPWILGQVEWTPPMTERAVVWLAEQTGKAVLKLTTGDYSEHSLSPLLRKYGRAEPINGEVFTSLGNRIRGRSKLPADSRVVVFSPHPDDDVISMGGVLRKLRRNENQITVAYMTSGNIAVFDHDVRRHLDFVERSATVLGLDAALIHRVHHEINEGLQRKQPGEIDAEAVQRLKQYIRESEAVSALEAVGLPPSAARFLNLPFYRTGEVRKRPIGDEDVSIVQELLEELRPELLFVAGDLSDPHGTHRLCKDAVDRALERYAGPHPEVWLYRGAWEEWSLTEADVLVPLSRDELRSKILAIFKHQSQKDVAPFPGGVDQREFWQRVEERNQETAAQADRLGLPEYFAMEAYRTSRR
jgi:glucosamine-6-phosphate deaminase